MTRYAVFGVLGLAAVTQAQTWNTYTNFSATNNPTGAWTYGWTPALGGTFTPFDFAFSITPAMPGWSSHQFSSNTPFIGINPTATAQGVPGTAISVPPHVAWFHPGLGGNELSVYRWTAPYAGRYAVSAAFQKIDLGNGIQHQGYVRVAGATVFNQPINTQGQPTTFAPTTYTLAADQTVDFIIGVINSAAGGAYAIDGTVSSSCYANCDGSTTPPILNVNDFVCFQSRFAAGDPYANCDGSTLPPVLNVNDFVCFQQSYTTGCLAP